MPDRECANGASRAQAADEGNDVGTEQTQRRKRTQQETVKGLKVMLSRLQETDVSQSSRPELCWYNLLNTCNHYIK